LSPAWVSAALCSNITTIVQLALRVAVGLLALAVGVWAPWSWRHD